jgi:hypothetical protein
VYSVEEQGDRAREQEVVSAAMAHTEHLLRHRMLNPAEAFVLLHTFMYSGTETAEARRDKLWRLCPLLPGLDSKLAEGQVRRIVQRRVAPGFSNPSASPLTHYVEWTNLAINQIVLHMPARCEGRERRWMLDDLYRFLMTVASPNIPLPLMASVLTNAAPAGDAPPPDLNSAAAEGRLSRQEVLRFYDRLEQSGQPLNALYARLGRLGFQVYTERMRLDPERVAVETDAVLDSVRKYDAGDPNYRGYITARYERHLKLLRAEAARIGGTHRAGMKYPLPQNPIAELDAGMQVTFEPIPDMPASWGTFIRCTDTMDAMWSGDTIHVLREPGKPEAIFHVEREPIARVLGRDTLGPPAWDGENFWIADDRLGIHLVSPSGQVLSQLRPEDGLPPYRHGYWRIGGDQKDFGDPLNLCAISPGRCIVSGQFGGDGRLWFAVVTRRAIHESSELQIDIFHSATKNAPEGHEPDDIEAGFTPGLWTTYVEPHRQRKLLLIGRQPLPGQQNLPDRGPMAIDLATLDVSILPAALPMSFFGYRWYGTNGHILTPNQTKVDVFSPAEATSERWNRRTLIEVESRAGSSLSAEVLKYEGELYLPGLPWFRIDPRTWTVEPIHSPGVPFQKMFQQYAVSAHYGLVAWNMGGLLHRVRIEPRKTEADGLAALYPFVPAAVRQRHHQAVKAIRGLGGSVDTRWGRRRPTVDELRSKPEGWPLRFSISPRDAAAKHPDYEWRTIVYLSQDWKGTVADIARLGELYNLRELLLVRAGVSDIGLIEIGQIKTLESLWLVETSVTSAGLKELAGLENLAYLRLQAAADGPHFDDHGLGLLGELPNLHQLTLYGPGFTDGALSHLQGFAGLRMLWLLDTSITQTAMKQLPSRVAVRDRPASIPSIEWNEPH